MGASGATSSSPANAVKSSRATVSQNSASTGPASPPSAAGEPAAGPVSSSQYRSRWKA